MRRAHGRAAGRSWRWAAHQTTDARILRRGGRRSSSSPACWGRGMARTSGSSGRGGPAAGSEPPGAGGGVPHGAYLGGIALGHAAGGVPAGDRCAPAGGGVQSARSWGSSSRGPAAGWAGRRWRQHPARRLAPGHRRQVPPLGPSRQALAAASSTTRGPSSRGPVGSPSRCCPLVAPCSAASTEAVAAIVALGIATRRVSLSTHIAKLQRLPAELVGGGRSCYLLATS